MGTGNSHKRKEWPIITEKDMYPYQESEKVKYKMP